MLGSAQWLPVTLTEEWKNTTTNPFLQQHISVSSPNSSFCGEKKIAVASKLRTNVYQIQAVLSVDTDPGGRGADKCSAGGVECEVTLNPIKARSARGYQTKERKRRHPLNSHRPHRACARRTRPPPPTHTPAPVPFSLHLQPPPPPPPFTAARKHTPF